MNWDSYYPKELENLDHLLVYQSPYQKCRLGKDDDGGYIICDMGDVYDIFLSGGVETDISFEEGMLEKYPNLICHAYDGTIYNFPRSIYTMQPLIPNEDQWIPIRDSENDWVQIGDKVHMTGISHKHTFGPPEWGYRKSGLEVRSYIAFMMPHFTLLQNQELFTWDEATNYAKKNNYLLPSHKEVMDNLHKGRLIYFRKNIGKETRGTHTTNFREYFDKYQNIFLKLDIENWENPFFESLTKEDLKKIKQLVIEFHSPYQVTIPKRLAETHWLVHIHPNNHDYLTTINGVQVPNCFECTYIRKEENETFPLNQKSFPDLDVDKPNKIGRADYPLCGYPYTCN
jgi:hypothetical protein